MGAALLGACSAACSVLVDTASSDAIVPPASPCRAPHLFCDDFDVGAIGATWDRKSGNTSLDPSTFSTPPFGFRAHVDKSFGNRSSRLEKSLTALPLACSFDLFVVGRGDSGGQSDLFSVLLDSAQTSTYVLLFGITPSSTYVGEYIEDADGGATPTVSVPNLTDRRWTHVTVELAPPVAKLTVDGTLVKTLPLAHPSVSVTAVHAGIAQARGGGAVDVVLDNVVCD